MKNKYARRSRISEAKFRDLIRCFALDLDACQIAAMTRLNRNTVNRYLHGVRERIAEHCAGEGAAGGVGRDEAGRPGMLLFGVRRQEGQIRAEVAEACSRAVSGLSPRAKTLPEAIGEAVPCRAYDGIIDLERGKCFVFRPEAAAGPGGVETFWSFAKRRLAKFNGLPRDAMFLHLKECEFRFNRRGEDLYAMILELLRARPLN